MGLKETGRFEGIGPKYFFFSFLTSDIIRQWKKSVTDIEGEILCGMAILRIRLSGSALTLLPRGSLPIHTTRQDVQRQQARLPPGGAGRRGEATLSLLP